MGIPQASRSKTQQYGGILLYKEKTSSILNSLVDFAVYPGPLMTKSKNMNFYVFIKISLEYMAYLGILPCC